MALHMPHVMCLCQFAYCLGAEFMNVDFPAEEGIFEHQDRSPDGKNPLDGFCRIN